MLGAFVNPSAIPNSQPHEPYTLAFEQRIGRKLAIVLHFQPFNSMFPTSDEAADLAVGRLPLVSWNCGDTNANVTAGKDDPLIDRFAKEVKDFGKPVMIRWFWEMNLSDSDQKRSNCYDPSYDPPSGDFDPSHFTQAWIHIVTRFRIDGVENVIWVWCPAASASSTAQMFYPGAEYVDWVGTDVYARKNADAATTIDAAYNRISGYGKPAVIAENGVDVSDQPVYFSALDGALRAHPDIRAYLYFDYNVPTGGDWALSSDGIMAFATFADGPYESAAP